MTDKNQKINGTQMNLTIVSSIVILATDNLGQYLAKIQCQFYVTSHSFSSNFYLDY